MSNSAKKKRKNKKKKPSKLVEDTNCVPQSRSRRASADDALCEEDIDD